MRFWLADNKNREPQNFLQSVCYDFKTNYVRYIEGSKMMIKKEGINPQMLNPARGASVNNTFANWHIAEPSLYMSSGVAIFLLIYTAYSCIRNKHKHVSFQENDFQRHTKTFFEELYVHYPDQGEQPLPAFLLFLNRDLSYSNNIPLDRAYFFQY